MSDDAGGFELACMRLAADCLQLANQVANPDLRRHFLRMSEEWTTQAEQGLGKNCGAQKSVELAGLVRAQASLH